MTPVDYDKAARIRASIAHLLHSYRNREKPVLKHDEFMISKRFRKYADKVITKAGKGSEVVILDKSDYVLVYSLVQEDPFEDTRGTISSILSETCTLQGDGTAENGTTLEVFLKVQMRGGVQASRNIKAGYP